MSSSPGRREVAYRLFAAEFEDAEFSYSESDEERAPNYVVSPTGARVNRLFVAGVLTEVEDVNPEMVRGRVVDPTGGFVTYAGQYQPEALSFLERADPPAFVALSGKARTFEPDDGDRIFTSVRPESINEVDTQTRDRWVVRTAERTLERIGLMAAAIEADLVGDELQAALVAEGVDERLAEGIVLAQDYYGTTAAYLEGLRDVSIDAVRVVADEIREVESLSVAPDDTGGAVDSSELASLDLTGAPTPQSAAAAAGVGDSETDSSVADNSTEESVETGTSDDSPDDVLDSVGEEPESPAEGSYEMDEKTRKEVEAEYGTEFSTADDLETDATTDSTTDDESIDEPGSFEPAPDVGPDDGSEASDSRQSDATDAEDEVGAESDTGTEADADAGTESGDEIDADPDSDTPSPDAPSDIDLQATVVETMTDLDDGEGATREGIVSSIEAKHGTDPDEIEEAIEDALMSGRCYEPTDDRFKPI